MNRPNVRQGAIWLALLVPVLLAVLVRWDAGPGREVSDYALYIMHARNILAGRPYGDVGCVLLDGHPFRCPPPYPPGLPLMLAGWFAAFGEHAVSTALLMLVMS